MLYTTDAIVLHRIRYNDKHNIVCLYTRSFGRISYMVPAASKKKTGRQASPGRLLLPLSELEIVADHRVGRSLQFIREARLLKPYLGIRAHLQKNSLVLFLGELLWRVIPEPDTDAALYDFLSAAFAHLDATEKPVANYHLCFILHLVRRLGIFPTDLQYLAEIESDRFDLDEKRFTTQPTNDFFVPTNDRRYMNVFLRMTFENYPAFRYTRAERHRILNYLLTCCRMHLYPFTELRSLKVLTELFD